MFRWLFRPRLNLFDALWIVALTSMWTEAQWTVGLLTMLVMTTISHSCERAAGFRR